MLNLVAIVSCHSFRKACDIGFNSLSVLIGISPNSILKLSKIIDFSYLISIMRI